MPDILEGLKAFAVKWNNLFPLDRWWREKYNIPFRSEAHLNANQADILFEYIESKVFDEFYNQAIIDKRKMELLAKGEWISKNKVDEEITDEEFSRIVI